jgi:AraC family transcriptional regulator of adaptative response / methylphosphotriester-DNA alkyltransferase methyltransferase
LAQAYRVTRRERRRANWPVPELRVIHLGPAGRIAFVPIQRPATIRHRTSLFEDAVAIVEEDYATDLSLDDIARRVASSRRQLQRAYAEIGHTTFREHLTRVRMRNAAEMLGTRALTVREVAHRVGYRQPAQFAKAFRRYQGVAPSAFRLGRLNSSHGGADGYRHPQAA